MYRVLCIEDDPMVREVNRQFIERVEGFTVIDFAKDGQEGLEKMQALQPDLVFMDVFMPRLDGLTTLQQLRQVNTSIDVVMVTAATNIEAVERALHLGIFDYIVKPFSLERIAQMLQKYRAYKEQLQNEHFTQQQIDALLHEPTVAQLEHDVVFDDLPKGLNKATLQKIVAYLRQANTALSAEQLATQMGIARVTARRYVDFLEKQQYVKVDIQYGNIGRPINLYTYKKD